MQMKRRYLAIGLLVMGCGAPPSSSVTTTSQALVGDYLSTQWEQAPAHYGTVAFGTNGS